jgi:anaerobic selenocysteine-containing dehydrogenase
LKTTVTACSRDCPGACSIIAQVENGKIVKLKGNKDHEFTSGFICRNTRNYLKDRFYSSKRILYPLLKEEGKWKRICL